jgi:lipopolysaccharide export system permease protein
LIDRYLLRALVGWFFGTIAVITFLLCMQTMPGFLLELAGVPDPLPILLDSLLNLIPEYIAVAVPISLFLGTALTFRRLALAGELDVLAAVGIGPGRLLRQPLLVGALCAFLVLWLRGYVQPAGERSLDLISSRVRSGEFGFGLAPGSAHSLAPDVTLFFARSDTSRHRIESVAFVGKTFTALAASASLQRSAGGGVLVVFHDGTVIPATLSNLSRVVRFRELSVLVESKPPLQHGPTDASEQLDRVDFDRLFGPGLNPSGAPLTRTVMRAAAAARIAGALFCFVMPTAGFVLAVPPKRSRSSIGIGVGIVAIVIFWRLSALIESRFAADALLLYGGLLAAFLIASLGLVRYQQRNGPGSVEKKLNDAAVRAYRAIARGAHWLRKVRRRERVVVRSARS